MLNQNFVDKENFEAQLLDRWSWMTEGMEEDAKLDASIVLENSYKQMIVDGALPKHWLENNVLSEDVIEEAPQMSGAVGDYVIPKVMFPVIRRVMEGMIAQKLVSVQPIQQPTGVIYYITYDYSNTKGEIKAGDEFSMNPQQTTPAFATWYSSEKIGPVTKSIAKGSTGTTTTVTFAEDAEGTKNNKIIDFLGTTGDYKIKRFEIFNATTGKALEVTFDQSDWAPETPADLQVKYTALTGVIEVKIPNELFEGTTENNFIAFLVYDQEGSNKIPEMEFHIDHMNVSTTQRKLKVRWTKESEQDMMAYHKISVENELVKLTSVQMNYELDREIIKFIDDTVISALTATHDWKADAATTGNNTQGNYLDRHRALAQMIYALATKVATYNHLGPADWAVASPAVGCVLQMLPDFKSGEIANGKTTFYNAGSLGNGSLAVYIDPNRCGGSVADVTLGYKSTDSQYGAGIVYSPYASWMSQTIADPNNFNSVRGFFNRYAIALCPRGQYNYARLTINNLPGSWF